MNSRAVFWENEAYLQVLSGVTSPTNRCYSGVSKLSPQIQQSNSDASDCFCHTVITVHCTKLCWPAYSHRKFDVWAVPTPLPQNVRWSGKKMLIQCYYFQKNMYLKKFRGTFFKISFRFEKYRVNSDFVSISRNIFGFRIESYRIV